MRKIFLLAAAAIAILFAGAWLATLSPNVDVWLYRKMATQIIDRPVSQLAQPGELSEEGGLQALRLAVKNLLEEGPVGAVALLETLPERLWARAGGKCAGRLGGLEPAAFDPVGRPG